MDIVYVKPDGSTRPLLGSSYSPQLASGMFGNTQLLGMNNAMDIRNDILAGQQAVWDREDTYWERNVASMKRAGLNPWLSVGSGGVPTSSNNPSLDAFSGLMSILEYGLKSAGQYDSHTRGLLNVILGVGKLLLGGAKAMM